MGRGTRSDRSFAVEIVVGGELCIESYHERKE